MLQITDEAVIELIKFTQQDLADGEFIRIARAYHCGDSRFQLTIDTDASAMDEAVPVGDTESGCTIVIEQSCLSLLQECTLDYNGSGFLFFDPVGSRC